MTEPPSLHDRTLHHLLDSIVDYAIYMLDVNGVVTNWNRGAERIKGYLAAEIVGQHFSRFYTPEDRAAGLPARALETALREGRFAAEGWRMRKDGTRFWASVVIDPIRDDDDHLIGYAKITRDVSDKRAADEALSASERQFRLLVTGVVDYALFLIDPNGIVSNWNAGAEHIKGYTAEEIVGQHISRFYTPEDRKAGVPARALATATETGRYEAEGWRVRKDGARFWASVVIDALYENGRLTGFAKITRDITEKREAQLKLQRVHERLAQTQKMEALGQLTGGVAHDFNNLLMVVGGQTHLLRSRLADDPRAIRALDAIEAAARRGENLTRHLLAFSRRQRLQPIALALADRAEGLHELIATSLPATIALDLDLSPQLWPVRVDPNEFEVAVLNLAVNARDAMPDGGTLAIAAGNQTLDGSSAAAGLEGEFVAVSIRDSGSGIAPDILARVFDPFFTTKGIDKGTGLGLSQVYGFAEQSGGRVVVASELGRGTEFTLYLPRWVGETAAAQEDAPAGPARPARILLVEDNPEVAAVASQLLEQLGHAVQVAGNAAAALAALATGPHPDLVFSDIVMAGEMDGVALARRLRDEAPGLPVLLATGYSQTAERIGREFPILRKPYNLADLNAAIADILLRAQAPPPGAKLVSLDKVRRARNGG